MDEIRQLTRRVPQLRDEPRVIPEKGAESDELVLWVREQMAPYAVETHPMRDDDLFLGGMTVGEYFALPDQEGNVSGTSCTPRPSNPRRNARWRSCCWQTDEIAV